MNNICGTEASEVERVEVVPRLQRSNTLLVLSRGSAKNPLHPWLSCGRTVGALVSGLSPDELIVAYKAMAPI